jgi:hypothetical protein
MICTIKTLDFQNMKYALSAKGKQWRVGEVIDICFLEGNRSQKEFVKLTAEEWLKYANIKFKWDAPQDQSDVRITFRENMGSWSYVGTDSLFITPQNATMNFGWLDKSTVLHEFGHMLGLLHEHQNPDGGIVWNESEVLRNLSGPPNNWSEDMIRHNVLNKVLPNTTNGTKFDPNSVMLYFFPGAWTSTGKGTKQNNSLSDIDKQHISQLYPFPNKTIQKKKNLFKKIFG